MGKAQFAILFFMIFSSTFISCDKTTAAKEGEPLQELLEGNKRFASDNPEHPHQSNKLVRELKENGQHPEAIVVSCADSRVAPELVFDQGLGDLFVIRTAGNIIGEFELGSIEYAVENLGTPLIIVMGHQSCGAIETFIEHKHDTLNGHMQKIIDYINAEEEEKALLAKGNITLEDAVAANVRHAVKLLRTSEPILAKRYAAGQLKIIGAIYNMQSGEVEIID